MSQFPTALPDFDDLDPQATLAVNNHAARHNIVHEELLALAGKVGIDGSADTDSLDFKVAALESDVTELFADKTDVSDVESIVDAAIAATKEILFPVGSVYTNYSDDTNPGTLLGFGTWVALGDRFLIGEGSGTFANAGDTGGAETHTLTTAEMPVHNHGKGTLNVLANVGNVAAGQTNLDDFPGSAGPISATNQQVGAGVTGSTADAGSGNAHNNLPPYRVVYMWRRTA